MAISVVDTRNTHRAGYLALAQHDPSWLDPYRNVSVKRLPIDEEAALAGAKKGMPDLKPSSAYFTRCGGFSH